MCKRTPGILSLLIGALLALAVGSDLCLAGTDEAMKLIDGRIGGVVCAGKWTVRVPAGAYAGTATITLSAAHDTCHVDIYPSSKNHFDVPVTLSCRVGLIPDLKSFILYRYDPLLRRWRPVVTSVISLVTGEVSAKLDHFSTYRAGKAGW